MLFNKSPSRETTHWFREMAVFVWLRKLYVVAIHAWLWLIEVCVWGGCVWGAWL